MWRLLRDRTFLHATAVLIGTMVGVGIFSIPLTFTKAGFLVGILLAFAIGCITVLFNLLYAEVILRTSGKHQLVGYVTKYLGSPARQIVFFTNVLGIWGALLAYIHYAGGFINNLLSQFAFLPREYYSVIFFIIVGIILHFGFRTVAGIEFFLTALFIVVILATTGVGLPHIDVQNYLSVNIPYWYLPYGVLLFAFAGLTSIPLQRQLLAGRERQLKPSIITAVVLTGVLYVLFATVVVGVSGFSTSDDALSGLLEYTGPAIVWLGSTFGILTIITSFLMLGEALIQVFVLDYHLRRRSAWLLVIVPPFILYLGGMRNAVDVISLVGALAIGLESLILLFVFRKARHDGDRTPEFKVHVPDWAMVVLGAVFIIGILFELGSRY